MKADAENLQRSPNAAALVAMGLLVAGNGFAASNVICDKARDQLLPGDGASLNIEKVDHVPRVTSPGSGKSTAVQDIAVGGTRPPIEASPQVATILEGIFDGDADLSEAPQSSSPLADTLGGDATDPGVDEPEFEVDSRITAIRAEMFRKDI